MAKDPAFLFYSSDFLTGTLFMTDEEVGIYIRFLCVQHQQKGSINIKAFDDKVPSDSVIREKFEKDSEGYYNKRLLEEMLKRQKKSESLSANALKRWGKVKQKQCNCIAIVMPTEDEDKDSSLNVLKNIEFEKFWDLYDKKVSKEKTIKLWNKLKDKEHELIIDYIPKYKTAQPDKSFRKNPDVFLRNSAWKDEIVTKQPIDNRGVRRTHAPISEERKKEYGKL